MYLQKTPRGFNIVMNGDVMSMKPGQAEDLIAMLMAEVPGLPDRIRHLWRFRTEPRGRIVQSFKAECGEIISLYHLEVFIPNARDHHYFTGPMHVLPLSAILNGWESYGRVIDITEMKVDLVSRKVAEKEVEKSKVAGVLEEKYGMTLEQVLKYVGKHKKLPPEKEPEVHSMTLEGAT